MFQNRQFVSSLVLRAKLVLQGVIVLDQLLHCKEYYHLTSRISVKMYPGSSNGSKSNYGQKENVLLKKDMG